MKRLLKNAPWSDILIASLEDELDRLHDLYESLQTRERSLRVYVTDHPDIQDSSGSYWHAKKEIWLNVDRTNHVIETFRHEFAHFIVDSFAREDDEHGKNFCEIARYVGCQDVLRYERALM